MPEPRLGDFRRGGALSIQLVLSGTPPDLDEVIDQYLQLARRAPRFRFSHFDDQEEGLGGFLKSQDFITEASKQGIPIPVPARVVADVSAMFDSIVSTSQTEEILGISVGPLHSLVAKELLRHSTPQRRFNLVQYFFKKTELAAFLRELRGTASNMEEAPPGSMSIVAATRSTLALADICSFIL